MEYRLIIAHECLANVKEDIKPLLEKHWLETEPNQETILLNPDWEQYALLDLARILHIFTARNEGILVGYLVMMVSKSIHNILVDQCRKSLTTKRTGDITSIHNYKDVLIIDNNDKDQRLLDLSSCIDKLKVDFPRQGEAVILKYFGGLLTKEIAETLNISFSSAEKDIAFAKTWMKTRLMA